STGARCPAAPGCPPAGVSPAPRRTRAPQPRAAPRPRRARPWAPTTRPRPCAPRTGRPCARAAPAARRGPAGGAGSRRCGPPSGRSALRVAPADPPPQQAHVVVRATDADGEQRDAGLLQRIGDPFRRRLHPARPLDLRRVAAEVGAVPVEDAAL